MLAFSVDNMKIIFYKDWNQIGCKFIPDATEEECRKWLEANHDISRINKVVIIDG